MTVVAAALLLTLLAGLGRALRGPDPADRILAGQLLGTGGVAVLLVLAEAQSEPALHDVALVLVMLAALATVVWLRWAGREDGDDT